MEYQYVTPLSRGPSSVRFIRPLSSPFATETGVVPVFHLLMLYPRLSSLPPQSVAGVHVR